jgi:hypothetical protein
LLTNKGNNKITELRTILQRESQKSYYVYKQTKSVNNRKTVKTVMTLTRYRHFQRNGGPNEIPRCQTSPSHHGSKVPAVTITVPKYRNKIGKTAAKAAPHSATQTSKIPLRHTLTKKNIPDIFWLLHLYTFSLYENASLIIFSAETEYISTRSWYRNIDFLRDRIRRIFL